MNQPSIPETAPHVTSRITGLLALCRTVVSFTTSTSLWVISRIRWGRAGQRREARDCPERSGGGPVAEVLTPLAPEHRTRAAAAVGHLAKAAYFAELAAESLSPVAD